MEERFFHDGKQKIHFLMSSPKQPSTTILFMIHGAHRQLQDSYAFSKNINVLDQKFTSISISLLGHGKSVPGKGTTIKNKSITIKD